MRKLLFAFLGTIVFTACERTGNEDIDDPDQNPPVSKCNVVEVSGNIDAPTVWKEGNVYVITAASLTVRSVLTIEPGVTVKLKDGGIDVVGGKIIAVGTPQKRIVFTSLADDRFCGDTNGDGTATSPAKGDWQQIYLNSTTETAFQYVDIFYAGKNRGGVSNAVRLSGANAVSFTFDNCRIAHTFYQDSSFDSSCAFFGTPEMKDATVSKFTNNAFYDNGKPVYFGLPYNLDASNKFHNPENPAQKNTYNGIYIHGNGGSNGTVFNWKHTEVPYVISEWFQVGPASTVNIGPNVIVKFKSPTDGIRAINMNVLLDPAAFLTSYKDDAHGGDTNGDGNSTAPATGDWYGFANTNVYTDYVHSPNILYAAN